MTFPDKAPVVGVPISTTSYDETLAAISSRPSDTATTVAVCNVHSVMSARRNSELREAINRAQIATPDGVPIVWGLRATARREQERVYGPELMRQALVRTGELGWNHYLYGSTPETLDHLKSKIREIAPDAEVVGSYSPPFRDLTEAEKEQALRDIRDSEADVVWVGLGMPKQELWMQEVRSELPGVALIGVGAAFDFLAGTKKQAPEWMQRAGLEWLFRLIQEPRRLWRRYLWNNPAYLVLLGWQIIRTKVRREG
ncbi:MAG: WecB/TagA/CpsF family glycosyltransferase [Acidimicrobiia bacterium]|nr:WecB/TagA/CpsF family glycosyltransferase [Acidimicrobiia bacterium]